jgi:hypothetical protein
MLGRFNISFSETLILTPLETPNFPFRLAYCSFFMKLALVQVGVLLEVVLSVFLNPAVLQSMRLQIVWHMSLVYMWVKRLGIKLDMTKRLAKVAPSSS